MLKRSKPEEIVVKLRQVDVLTAQGKPVAEAVRSIGAAEVTYYRWHKEFGGLKLDQVKRLKELETENQLLRRAVADLTLDKLILSEATRENALAPRASAFALSMSERCWICRSGASAALWASTAQHSARRRGAATTKSNLWPT